MSNKFVLTRPRYFILTRPRCVQKIIFSIGFIRFDSRQCLLTLDLLLFPLYLGPFRDCFDYVDLRQFYESCLYDACVLGADSDAICSTYEQCGQLCRRSGQSVLDWRSLISQCGMQT